MASRSSWVRWPMLCPLGRYWRSSRLDTPMFVKLRPVRRSHGRRTP
jgi:hypothetical protein